MTWAEYSARVQAWERNKKETWQMLSVIASYVYNRAEMGKRPPRRTPKQIIPFAWDYKTRPMSDHDSFNRAVRRNRRLYGVPQPLPQNGYSSGS